MIHEVKKSFFSIQAEKKIWHNEATWEELSCFQDKAETNIAVVRV